MCPHYITHYRLLAIIALILVAVVVWFAGRAPARITILVLLYASICGVALWFARPDDRWDVLTSVATALAVMAALFSGQIEKLVYRARVRVYVGADLIDPAHGVLWIRGKVTNTGDRAVERCRIKLLRIEGQPSRIENGLLQWQGGVREPITLGSEEHLIFDIGTRPPAQDSSLELLAYIGDNELSHDLNPGQTYNLELAIYGDNTRTRMHAVRIAIGAAAEDIEIL